MKNILSLVFAGIIGGAITLGGFSYFQRNNTPSPSSITQARLASIKSGLSSASEAPGDFSLAAELAMNCVVHIKAVEAKNSAMQRYQQQRRNDPFADFFGNDGSFFFGSPFGGNGRGFQQQAGTGSGVIISSDGYIVTNNHVVDFADEVTVTLNDNRTFSAKIIGTDPTTDMAVLKIDANNLPVMQKADSDAAKVGEWVLAVGNPFELNSTVTAGIISAKGRTLEVNSRRDAIESFIQTDAVVNPGNSGGALVDTKGRLIGINTAIQTHTGTYEGYSFAIPSNLMDRVVNDIIKFGSSQRGYIGVEIADMSDVIASGKKDLTTTTGVFVKGVSQGGPAQFAGVLPNDIITEVNGRNVKNAAELRESVNSIKIGETVNLTINRDGDIKQIAVKIRKREEQ
ncbi:MAG: trypsin-like peptidase domain-containing protein [Saprospiraceae bacterium]|nr:trypsin-like peptidase domain-containing protein [Saprospiraceae bacterium]